MIGSQLGPYQIIEQVGAGAQATVYRAYHPSTDRDVALKVLPRHFAADPTFTQRFQQEARLVARLEHAHILPVYDFGEDQGVAYLAMRFLEAGTLKDILTQRQLPLTEIVHLVCQVASALDYGHRQGVVHRDIKPANIMVDREGNSYLTDFGIAKMLGDATGLTASGTIGTPAYMSPEQGMSGRIDGRSDIYSLGVLLYQLASGSLPYESDTAMGVILMHLNEPVPAIRERFPEIPVPVEQVIQMAMAKDPMDRYQSAAEFCEALRDAVGLSTARIVPAELRAGAEDAIQTMIARREQTAAIGVTSPGVSTRPRPAPGGRAILFGLGGLFLLAIVAGVVVLASGVLKNLAGGGDEAPPGEAVAEEAGAGGPAAEAEAPSQAGEETSAPGGAPKQPTPVPLPTGEMPYIADMEGPDPLQGWEASGDWRIENDLVDFAGGTISAGNRTLFSETTGSRLTVLSSIRPQPDWVTADEYFVTMRVKLRRGGAAARLLLSQSALGDFYAVEFSTSDLILKRFENGENTVPYPEHTALPLEPGRWYDVGIWRSGQHVAVYVNDQWFLQILDLPPLPPGTIGLEVLGEGGVFIDDLTLSATDPASEDFEGVALPETWAVVDGVTLAPGNDSQALAGSNLESDEVGPITGDLGDFTLICQVQARQGNGGLQFRKTSGGHYEIIFEGGHVFLDRIVNRGQDVRLAEARNVYGPSTPRTVVVRALGPHVTVTVGGQITADLDDPAGQAAGGIALEFGEVSDFLFDDCVIYEQAQPSNTSARFVYDLWESMFTFQGQAAKAAVTDDFSEQCTTCWVGAEGTPANGPGTYDPAGFYTISATDTELWWLFNDALTVFEPTITTIDQPSTNFIALANVKVAPDPSGGTSSGWVGVRGEPSFVGAELEQIRLRLTSGPEGNVATVEAAGTVSQEVFHTAPWPDYDAVAGGDGWHKVMIVAQGDQLAFFANGTFLTTVQVADQDRLLGTVSIGVSPNSSASFDNVEIWDLRGLGPPSRSYP